MAALFNAAVPVFIYTLVPEFLMRFIVWLLVHTVYRLHKRGLENIPAHGPAVIVCNHVSFVDALVITAACPRPIRFVMHHAIFRLPVLRFVFRTNRCIPIASAKEDPKRLERAYDEIAAALEAGELVGIFPEGVITDTGELYPFKPGITRIVARTPVPVVPLALRGLWGTITEAVKGDLMKSVTAEIEGVKAGYQEEVDALVDQVSALVDQVEALSQEQEQVKAVVVKQTGKIDLLAKKSTTCNPVNPADRHPSKALASCLPIPMNLATEKA